MLIVLILLYAALQTALLAWAYHSRKEFKRGWLAIIFFLAIAAGWTLLINDSARVIVFAPLKHAVVLFNLVPLFLAAAVAMLIATHPKALRRTVLYALLLFSADFYFWGGAFYTPFATLDRWDRECCLQTTEYSCGAAAAATLLKLHGIEARESDMMKPCLTSFRGTSFWGLYHGLREMAGAHGKRVIVSDASAADFITLNKPAIVFVMLNAELDKKDKRYSRDWGWMVNSAHAVVFLGMTRDGRARIADPRLGIERWKVEGLEQLWQKRAMYIE